MISIGELEENIAEQEQVTIKIVYCTKALKSAKGRPLGRLEDMSVYESEIEMAAARRVMREEDPEYAEWSRKWQEMRQNNKRTFQSSKN